MHPVHRLIAAAVWLAASASATAQTTVYTSSAAFLSHVAPGSYTESFSGLIDPPPGAAAFSAGTFSYEATAPSDIYLAGGFLGASFPEETLKITFTSGNVTAFGANFYYTDQVDVFQPVSVTLTLGDGTVETFTPSSLADSYRGFVTSDPIAVLTISAPTAGFYAGLDNATVGKGVVTSVPEPSSWALMALALAGLCAVRRRAA